MADGTSKPLAQNSNARFATTHWSIVLAAGDSSARKHTQALSARCETYWFPLYAYLRRRRYDRDRAQEYTQAFFARLLEKHGVRLADPARGRFRYFLLAAFKNFLADEHDRAKALKRGGGRKIFSINFENAENQYSLEPADELTPEKLFAKSWALTVLDRTIARLKAELAARGKENLFDNLKVYMTAEAGSVPYRDLAARLNMTEGTVRVAVHRLRKRYKHLLRDEIAQTVATEEEIDDEIRDLFRILGS